LKGNNNSVRIRCPVSIVILNWNGWKDTLKYLESLSQINYTNYHIIIVNNVLKMHLFPELRSITSRKIKIKPKFIGNNQKY